MGKDIPLQIMTGFVAIDLMLSSRACAGDRAERWSLNLRLDRNVIISHIAEIPQTTDNEI